MRHSVPTVAVLFILHGSLLSADFVWLEGEKPAKANFKWKAAAADKADLLSGKQWLMAEERVKLTDEGQIVEYDVPVPEKGKYNLWLRIGFEWIRPHVMWRFGEGKWTTVGIGKPIQFIKSGKKTLVPGVTFDLERRSTNVKELGYWAEAAWWHVGDAELEAGQNHLTLRFIKTETENPLLALDVVALVKGQWTPEGKLKPGETYRAEIDQQAAAGGWLMLCGVAPRPLVHSISWWARPICCASSAWRG